ncbi:hypothetical protein [Ensifer aridi]|uniref:hypothetical protein n=1 Tax=Ensifer aridi TaxID=1708715 RepID=UPI000A10F403|nr:hypothetical protein [Ensifer aridi]
MDFARAQEEERQALLRQIGSLKKTDLPVEYGDSLTDEILQWQEERGLRPKSEREGISPGLRQQIYNAGMERINAPRYTEQARQLEDGSWVEPGLFNTWVPAKPLLRTVDDWQAEQREKRAFEKAADPAWAAYRVTYPDDNPDDVNRAFAILSKESGLSASQLTSLAEGPDRYRALEHLHQLAMEIEEARSGDSSDDSGDDGRSNFGSGTSHAGSVYTPQVEEPTSANNYGDLGKEMIAWQKANGLRRY